MAFLRRRFAEEGIDIGKSTSQVMPVMVNNDAKVFAVAEKIQDRGLFLNPVTYPAVPKHKSRLRISVSAAHSEEELETAVQIIAGVLREEGICRGLTRYGYSNAISGFFEFPTENARRILPRHLEPAELHHGSSIFSMTVFDFTESEVGSYGEVVMSVIVSPLVKPGEKLPEVGLLSLPRGHHHQGRARPRHRALAPAPLDGGRGHPLRAQGAEPLTAKVGRGRRARGRR